MDGPLRVAEFEELTGVCLPESAHKDVESIGGPVMAVLDRVSTIGD
jgi:hypothetical protein